MTTEDDFQNALDACPEDWQTRLVFADWLDERGDPRAEGYRALGVLRLRPEDWGGRRPWTWWDKKKVNPDGAGGGLGMIPNDWLNTIPKEEPSRFHRDFLSRREAEDAAAIAFSKLPLARRCELLDRLYLGPAY